MKTPLLQVENLNITFQTSAGIVRAVNDVSFSIQPGEIFGIVGESGSGKSVTARAISGLLPVSSRLSGSITFKGQQLTGFEENEFQKVRGRDISMIFQNPSSHLDPLMTIGKQIGEPLIFHSGLNRSESRTESIKRLEDVQISSAKERVNSYPHQLSGGMKQRAMIASAIACNPDLLIADEPTTALDVTVQAHILKLLEEMNASRGLSIILISHDLAVVAQTCHKIAVMRKGCIVEHGDAKSVLENPQHDYTRLLLDAHPSKSKFAHNSLTNDRKKSDCLLSIKNLSVEFDIPGRKSLLGFGKAAIKFKALDNVSLSVHRGESLGIVGESGSGKSTLARSIVGLVKLQSGQIEFNNEQLQRSDRSSVTSHAHEIQMIFQNPFDALNPRMSVKEAVSEPLLVHQLIDREQVDSRVTELLELVEFDPALASRKPLQLSGGQCQRIGIARALAMNPKLIIADEITSALDVTIQAQIINLLNNLKNQMNLTLLFISHDLNLVESFCDRVCIFRSGQLIESGDVTKVMSNPENEYTRNLIASVPSI